MVVKSAIRNMFIAVAFGATAGAGQAPPEVAENRCEGIRYKPPGSECWQKLANHPECYFWTDVFILGRTVDWTGECREGLAQGEGKLQWSGDPPSESGRPGFEKKQTGSFKDGKKHGHWGEGGFDGVHAFGRAGPYVNGKKHGQWEFNFGGALIAKGPYVNGERHGRWVERNEWRGETSEGRYEKGKKQGKWLVRTHRRSRSSNKTRVKVRIYKDGEYVGTGREWEERGREKR